MSKGAILSPQFQIEAFVKTEANSNYDALFSAFTCPGNCGFQCTKFQKYTQHLSKIRVCHLCPEEFHGDRASQGYDRHMKKHRKAEWKKQTEPSLTCQYCGITFKYRHGIERHQKSRCVQTQGRDNRNSLSKSKALGAKRSDNVELKIAKDTD